MRRRAFVLHRVGNVVVGRLTLRRFRGGDLLFLTTTGRKRGQPRTTRRRYLTDQQLWVVACNGGAIGSLAGG